jgi:polygalacturonase
VSRRRFLAAATALATQSVWSARAQSRPTIDVKKLGASGNGKTSDRAAVRRAVELAARERGGATMYFPPGEYYLGAAEDDDLIVLKNLENIRLVGERATLSCTTYRGRPGLVVIAGSRNIAVEGLAFHDRNLDRDETMGAYAISVIGDERRRGTQNLQVSDCSFDSVLGAVCTHGDEGRAPPVRGITLKNLSIRHAVWGINFSDSGDELTGRGITCVDVERSYFPYGVSHHDIELDIRDNHTGFTDILISCYWKDTKNLRVKFKSRGKRTGDTIVNMDHQNYTPGPMIRNVSIDADVDDADCRVFAAIQFRAMTRSRQVEAVTDRRWDAITLDGDLRICERTKLIYQESINRTPGTLTIGPRLARHPQLPKSFPGFRVTVART